MSKNKTVSKGTAHYIVMTVLSFCMTFFAFLLICAGVIQATLLNPQYFKNAAKNSGYIAECSNALTETFKSYGLASNFDAEVFVPFAADERIIASVNQGIDYLYGKGNPVDYSIYEKELYEHLIQNVKDRKIDVTASIETGVQNLAESCRAEYENYTTVPFLEFAIRMMENIQKPMIIVLAGLSIVMLLVLVFMWMISRKSENFLPYIVDGCFSLSILSIVLPILALAQKVFERANISPESLRLLLTGYVNGVMQRFILIGMVLAVVAVGLLIFTNIQNKKKKSN